MIDARRGRGTYTDDTEMTIALAESLLAEGAIVSERLAERFLAGCDPARGYGAGTVAVFRLWSNGVEVDSAAARVFDGEGSVGNGQRCASRRWRFGHSALESGCFETPRQAPK